MAELARNRFVVKASKEILFVETKCVYIIIYIYIYIYIYIIYVLYICIYVLDQSSHTMKKSA